MSEQNTHQNVKSYRDITRSDIFPTHDQTIICHAVDGLKFKDHLHTVSKYSMLILFTLTTPLVSPITEFVFI